MFTEQFFKKDNNLTLSFIKKLTDKDKKEDREINSETNPEEISDIISKKLLKVIERALTVEHA